MNDNGKLLTNLCANTNFVIFPLKTIPNISCTSPDKPKLDYVMIASKSRSSLLDVINNRGTDIKLPLNSPSWNKIASSKGKQYKAKSQIQHKETEESRCVEEL